VIADRTGFARRLFAGIAPQYERMGALLSFGQDARWRRGLPRVEEQGGADLGRSLGIRP